jgi:hypothetical protein
MASEILEVEIPAELVILANSTKPEGVELEDWILEWTKFGLKVSELASMRKEALDIGANIEKAAVRKFAELVDEETVAFEVRLKALEDLTDVEKKKAGFGKLFEDMRAFVNPEDTKSAIFTFNTMLKEVDDEKGLIRKAIRKELTKDGGVTGTLNEIREKLGLDEKEKEVSRKSTLKGDKIEDTLLLNLENIFPGNDLTFNKLTSTTGAIKGSKKGDVILQFGTDHALHGCPIIYEMKSDDAFFLEGSNPDTSATDYLTIAMRNRECKVGIFVMDKATANEDKGWRRRLTVAGDKIFVVWDPDDPSSDWLLTTATYIAIGRNKPLENVIDPEEREAIRVVTMELEAEANRYVRMRTYIERVKTNAENISEEIRIGDDAIKRCIDAAKTTLKVLEMDSTELTDIEFEDVDTESGGEEVVDEVDEEDASGEQDVEPENKSDDNGIEYSEEESNQNDQGDQ